MCVSFASITQSLKTCSVRTNFNRKISTLAIKKTMNSFYKIFLLFSIYNLTFNISLAQHPEAKRATHWYFGNGAGLDFSSGSPVAVTNGALHTSEGCAAMSDTAGNLLFYTDGDTIWDRNHNPMPNGTQLTGCPILGSSSQASIIIPQPNNDSLYYVFTTDCWENFGAFGLRYNVININLNGGLGDVIPTQKNKLLYTPSTEGLTATYNCDKTGVWIMSHEYNTNNYVCYFLDATGINTTPIISSIGGIYTDFVSYMRFSPNGKKFASFNYGGLSELFDFKDGLLSDFVNLPDGGYGTCFSNDNSKLYFTRSGNTIIQFDINSTNIPASLIVYYDIYADNATYASISNAIDNTLIISSIGKDSISTIVNPNIILTSTIVNRFNISLDGKQSGIGITDFIQSYFNTLPPELCSDTNKKIDTTTIMESTFPNVFTPNNDGINDVFSVNLTGYEEINWKIYNRWGSELKTGELKIENERIVELWDGRTNAGEKVPDGTYYYIINLTKKRGEHETKKGFVQILN
ncbi:hypothetical protein FLAV_00812 [Flavobacteriales bacterium]|nr:gliding motility-associated C-terminal domain-containing protein [Bacteroidota bacterium]CAG0963172.1 hypothetical protein FLAV_00812 [Flavobacteriales bacterium]